MGSFTGSVAWVDGDGPLATLRGGFNVQRGRQSIIDVHPIIALHGASKVNLFDVVPAFSKGKLFRRDRLTCAYCGVVRGVRRVVVVRVRHHRAIGHHRSPAGSRAVMRVLICPGVGAAGSVAAAPGG